MKYLLLTILLARTAFAATAGFPGLIGTESTGNLNIGAVQQAKNNSTAGFPGAIGTETTGNLSIGAIQPALFSGGSLMPGTLTIALTTVDCVKTTWTSASGGTPPITAQLQITANPVGTWTNVSGATANPGYALNLAANTTYNFRVAFTDATPTSVYSSTNGATTAATAVISILSPVAYQVIQRSGLATNLPITVTYTGTPANVEAKWGSGPWTTIVSSAPAAGPGTNITTNLPNQFQGQGTLEVRFSNDNTVTTSTANVGIGLVVLNAGQSNELGIGTHNQNYTNTLKACLFGNDYVFKELSDPYDSNVGQLDLVSDDGGQSKGSWVPLAATELMNYFQCPVMFVPCAKGSTSVTQWQPGSSHVDRTTLYGSSVYRGLQTGPGLVMWWQGETDAQASMIQSTYNTDFEAVANSYKADLGIRILPTVLQISQSSATENGAAPIRAAIVQAASDNANVAGAVDLSDLTVDETGGVHFIGDAALLTVGLRMAEKVKALFFSAQKSSMF